MNRSIRRARAARADRRDATTLARIACPTPAHWITGYEGIPGPVATPVFDRADREWIGRGERNSKGRNPRGNSAKTRLIGRPASMPRHAAIAEQVA